MRSAGILLPVTSLPSPWGVGTMGRTARGFVDFLHRSGQSYWQILPICPTGYGNSPYQSFSSFAGNPYLIDLDTLARLTLAPEPPCVPDLSREELVELVEIIQHCSVTGREWAMRYYTALLRRSLSLPNVMDFVASGEDVEVIAEKLLQAAR